MTPEQWERVKELYTEAAARDAATRETFLRDACQGDETIFNEVQSLLAHDTGATLDCPVAPRPPAVGAFGGGALVKQRYRLERELVRGGFGAVYLARDQDMEDRRVVVKIQLAAGLNDPWWQRKFRDEVRALSLLDHPGVVSGLDWGQLPDGQFFLVMQYVEGRTLRNALRPEGMPLDEAAHLIRQMGQAIDAVHRKGILHRDLKPENVMLQPEAEEGERVRIIDFGIATVRAAQESAEQQITRAAGTIPYMSPEQLNGQPCAATDIYALGVIAYEMVTGRRPYSANDAIQLFAQLQAGPRLKPRDLRPELSEAAQETILQALAYSAEARPASAREWGERLARQLAPPALEVPRAEPGRRKAVLWGILGFLALGMPFAYRAWSTPESELRYAVQVQMMNDGKPAGPPSELRREQALPAGSLLRVVLHPAQPGYLYLLDEPPHPGGNASEYYWLAPGPKALSAFAPAGQDIRVPAQDWIVLDQQKGTEKIWLVWARKPVEPLERIREKVGAKLEDHLTEPATVAAVRSVLADPRYATKESENLLRGGAVMSHSVTLRR